MGFWLQLRLLLWKNFSLRRRQKLRFIVEMIWPLFLFLILMWVRSRGLKSYIHECHFDSKALPSAGLLPFAQSLFCNFNNTCHAKVREDRLEKSLLSVDVELLYAVRKEILDNAETLSNVFNPEESQIIDKSTSAVSDFIRALTDESVQPLNGTIEMRKLFVDIEEMGRKISSQNIISIESFLRISYSELNANILKNFFKLRVQEEGLWNSFCNESNLFKDTFNFEEDEDFIILQGEICKLDNSQLFDLISIIYEHTNYTELFVQFANVIDQNSESEFLFQDVKATYYKIWSFFDQLMNGKSLAKTKKLLQSLINFRESMENRFLKSNGTVQILESFLCGDDSPGIFSKIGEFSGGAPHLNELREQIKLRRKPENFSYHYDNSTTKECNSLFYQLEESEKTKFVFTQMKPYIRGKILYSPKNNAVDKIIAEVDKTFGLVNTGRELAVSWSKQLHDLFLKFSSLGSLDEALTRLISIDLGKFSFLKTKVLSLALGSWNKELMQILEARQKIVDYSTSLKYYLNATDEILTTVSLYLSCFEEDRFEGYNTEEDVTARALELISENRLWAGIIFTNIKDDEMSLPPYIRYKIRMDADKVDNTRRLEDRLKRPGPRRRAAIDLKYITYGFAYLQDIIEHSIIRLQTNSSLTAGIFLKQFPYPCYIFDQFIMAISLSFPMFMVLAWVYNSSMIIKSCVYEKEQRLKEVMKVMGLGNGVHWFGWFIESFMIMFITIILLVIILVYGKVLENSDPVVIFFFLLCFMLATITMSFMISTFFSRANVAAAAGGIIFFILFLPYRFMFEWEERLDVRIKIATSLISNVAFGFGCSYLAHYEEEGVGAQWHNLASSTIPHDDFSLAKCMLMMLLDSVIYMIITWYIEAVFPGMYGVPKPWYFFAQKSYWFGKNISDSEKEKLDEEDTIDLEESSKDFEKEPHHLQLGVCIEKLRKKYGDKVAVDNLSLRFYEGQITSFLGHNGAGKTTTISILTGLFPPTSGTAKIYQLDISKDIDTIRRSLGMCPQHNVLFNELTVIEHLQFYAQLKGLDKESVMKESDQMINDLGLPHKRDELAKNLSGGMQRKLSVAIAFVGGSRTVILDEPTAGVDPYSRRSIWELLLKYKKGRTIILTTHHMDEADLLGDRIAIIAKGKLRCCGSSLFLKSLYGDGFYLTLVKSVNWSDSPVLLHKKLTLSNGEDEIEADNYHPDTSSNSSHSSNQDSANSTSGFSEATNKESQVQILTSFINSYCPGSKLMEDVGSELCYLLPVVDPDKKCFEKLFESLDVNLDDLRISSYGISDTALEEVFLKVAHYGSENETSPEKLCETVEGMTEGGNYPTPLRSGSLQRQNFKDRLQQAFKVNHSSRHDSIDDMALHVGLTSGITEIKKQNGVNMAMNYAKVVGRTLIRRQFFALHSKRFHYTKRNYKGLFSEIVLPPLFVLLAMLLTLIVPPKLEGPPLELNPWSYGPPNYIFFSNDKPSSSFTNSSINALLKPPGIGVRCLYNNPTSGKKCIPVEESFDSLIPSYNVSALSPISKPCKCSIGTLECPAGAGGPDPPAMLTSTTDTLLNMTGRNISDWLLKTRKKYYKQRYGGFSMKEIYDSYGLVKNIKEALTIIQLNSSLIDQGLDYIEYLYSSKQAQVWFNNKGWVSSVAYMNTINNALLRSKLPPDHDPKNYGISVTNHPLNFTRLQLQDELLRKGGLSLLHAICVVFALSFVPASFVLFLIEERTSNAKHLQFVSGVKPLVYWSANYFWDFCSYLIPSLMCIFIFLSFDAKAYVSEANFPGLIGLLLMYGWASIPLMYPASYIFTVPSSAFVALASTNLFIGIVTTVATFVLELFKEDQELQDISAVLRVVFLIFPHFCLGRGLIDMATNQLSADALEKFGIIHIRDPFEWDFLGRNLLSMLIQGIVYFTFTILIEYKFFFNRKEKFFTAPISSEDIDVSKERERVLSGQTKDGVLRLENLTKVYRKGKNPAVNQLCLSVKSGECFGLLGVNGAGKTSTFKMLTGNINATAGNAYLNGYSILTKIDQVRQNLGYCPQFDALSNLLTGREHLRFYAALRGVPSKYIDKEVTWAIDKLGLANHADKPAGTYSGGNKRKLSTAIALIGSPPIIFLDEPTTGMDPKARRFLWNCILDILRDGRSVILTSHSMEECEALCTRLAIMVNGELKCLGSIQHLKGRFGQGYTLTIHVGGESPALDPVIAFVNSKFNGAVLKEQHHNQLQFQLPNSGITLCEMFHNLEVSRDHLNILDYSLSQTTLDQVFINFAKQQKDISEEEDYEMTDDKFSSSGGVIKLDEIMPADKELPSRLSRHIALDTNDRETIV